MNLNPPSLLAVVCIYFAAVCIYWYKKTGRSKRNSPPNQQAPRRQNTK